jgi:hypothetical protein
MAASPDGVKRRQSSSFGRLQYVVVDLPKPPRPAFGEDETIRSHLANSRSVLIRGPPLEGPNHFTNEEIEAYKGSLAQQVEWQG